MRALVSILLIGSVLLATISLCAVPAAWASKTAEEMVPPAVHNNGGQDPGMNDDDTLGRVLRWTIGALKRVIRIVQDGLIWDAIKGIWRSLPDNGGYEPQVNPYAGYFRGPGHH
jgi:hypothetical protein